MYSILICRSSIQKDYLSAIPVKALPNLDDLLIDVEGMTNEEIETKARDLYKELYTGAGKSGKLRAHDGEEVIFWADRFDHAFYNSSEWRQYSSEKNQLDKERIKRIKWIGEVIAGNVPNSECWEVSRATDNVNPQRLYIVKSKCYVVWLEPRANGGWKFSSAYVANYGQLRRYSSGKRKIWKK